MINNINFKKWLVKSEAIEYQPENWLKFHRQMTNKFKKFEEKYTKEFFQKIKKEIKRIKKITLNEIIPDGYHGTAKIKTIIIKKDK